MELMSISEDEGRYSSSIASSKSLSAPTTPTNSTQSSSESLDNFLNNINGCKGRRVKFPSDDVMVTNYFEAPDPWFTPGPQQLTPENLVDAYRGSCQKQGIKPIAQVIDQLEGFSAFENREHDLIVRGEKLDPKQCDALEEILKRLRFNLIDLDSCSLDDESASAIFDMIEYYESAIHVNISNNKGIDIRGWQALCRMLKKTSCLLHLELRNSALSEQTMLTLGRALRLGSHLISLHLDNSGLSSRSLVILVAALKLNSTLKELYLCENKLTANDGIQIANLLKANSTLELLDISGNQFGDVGLEYISEGLSQQTTVLGDGLKTLIVADNQITPKGLTSLSNALLTCNALKGLNLSYNNLSGGVIKLKDALMRNITLLYLGLRNTHISCEDAISLAEYVAENKRIMRIDLRDNNIQAAGLMALALAIKHNKYLTNLDLNQDTITKDPTLVETCQLFINDIEDCTKSNLQNQQRADVDEQYIQSLGSPEINYNESGGLHFPSLNGIFKQKLNISLPLIGKKSERKISDPINVPNAEIFKSRTVTESDLDAFGFGCSNTQKQKVMLKPILRSASLGSWEHKPTLDSPPKTRRSGRFSVSPVPDLYLTPSVMESHSKPISESDDEERSNVSTENNKQTYRDNIENNNNNNDNNNNNSNQLNNNNVNMGDIEEKLKNNDEDIKPKKKLTFILPEVTSSTESLDCSFKFKKNRRMSTPALPIAGNTKVMHKRKLPSFKTFKTLDSLDLRSSVPLSPTRLQQGWDFDPSSLRLPQEVEDVMKRLN